MDSLLVVAVGGPLSLVGAVVLYWGTTRLRPVYHILRDDPLDIRDLPLHSGPAEVEGAARPEDGQTVRGPFTQTECLAYEYEVQELQSSGQNSYWKTLDEGVASVPFRVEDDTGMVRVDHERAALQLEDHSLRVKGGEEPPDRIAQYISETEAVDPQQKTMNLLVTEIDYGNDQRFIERRLDIGEKVHVYGDVERAPAGDWGSRLVDARLTSGGKAGTLVVSDSSERGTAWYIARVPLLVVCIGLALLAPGLWLLASGLVLLV